MDHSIVVIPHIWACYLWQIKTNEMKVTLVFGHRSLSDMSKRFFNVLQWTSYSECLLFYSAWYVSYSWLSLHFLQCSIWFIQQFFKYLSLLYIKWCSG